MEGNRLRKNQEDHRELRGSRRIPGLLSERQYPVSFVGDAVPDTGDVLRKALAGKRHVLDVGCGDGRRLIETHKLFARGTGIDESDTHMIACAIRTRNARGIGNLDFIESLAAFLPFSDNTFDMVFSERGPLGHGDKCLAEALRVLQPGGLIFVETGGSFGTLQTEKERFERLGVAIQTLACRRYLLEFDDFYELLDYLCSGWVYSGKPLPAADDAALFEDLLSEASTAEGKIRRPWGTIWIAGTKIGQQPTQRDAVTHAR